MTHKEKLGIFMNAYLNVLVLAKMKKKNGIVMVLQNLLQTQVFQLMRFSTTK